MDFLSFFGLKEEPFRLTPDPAYFFPSKKHNNGLLSMNYCTEQREGFCLVIGEPGTGKTTLLNVFIETWKERAEIAMVLTPRLSPEEFLLAVLEDFGITSESTNKNDIIKAFRDFLLSKSREQKEVLILVDEAQNLPDETLEELRLLSNLETEEGKLIHIVLIGQPELQQRLNSPDLRQLNQRIVTRINLTSLNNDEIRDYIHFRLMKAGRGHVKFYNTAMSTISRYSLGIPRLINTITTRSMMSAFLEESGDIKSRHVRYALKSLDAKDSPAPDRRAFRPAFVIGLSVIVLLFLTVPFLINRLPLYMSDFKKNPVETVGAANSEDKSFVQPSGPTDVIQTDKSTLSSDDGPLIPDAESYNSPESHYFQARITTWAANVRDAPSLRGDKVHILYKGNEIKLLNETAEYNGVLWYRIEIDGVDNAWISSKVLEILGEQ